MKEGDLVLVDYIGKADGEIFDLTVEEKAEEEGLKREDVEYKPVPVLVGKGYVIEGLGEAVEDMEVGDEKEIEVPEEKAYGVRDPEDVETYPQREFERQGVKVRPGEEIMIGNRRGKVRSVNSGRVRVDFNHPLAGKKLEYWLKVVEKVEDDEEIAEYIYGYRVGSGEIEFDDNVVKIPEVHSHGDHEHELPDQKKEQLREEILENTGFEKVEFTE